MQYPICTHRGVVAVALLALAAAPTLADDAIETVFVSGSRTEQSLASSLNSVSVVGSEAIKTVSHTHINELLNRVPGVWISRGNGQEHLTAIRSAVLTGPGSCGAFYMAEDGIPLRAPGFCNVNQLFDANTEQAARIEVIRGPGTAVHGSNALNGVINIVTRVPTADPLTRLTLEGGPHDYGRVKVYHSQGNDTHRFGIAANGAHDGGYKDDSGFDQQKMTARYDYDGEKWRNRTVLSASNLNQDTAGFLEGKDAYKVESLKDTNSTPGAFRDTTSTRLYSRFEREGSNGSFFIVTPYLRHTEMNFFQHFLPQTPLEENGEQSAGVQTAFFTDRGDHTRLHHGFDIELTNAYLKQTQEAPTNAIFPTGKHYDYEVDALNAAWFVGGDWQPKPERELSAGVRYEIQRYDYDNQMINGSTTDDGSQCRNFPNTANVPCRYSRPADDTDMFYNWSAYLGYREALDNNVDAVIHFSQGFRAPQATELYRLQAGQIKADLDSEEIVNGEVGLRGSWSAVRANLTAYYLKKNNIILRDASRQTFSGGKTERRGIELDFDWQILTSLSIGFQGSYAKTLYDNDALPGTEGNEVDTAPRQTASAQLRWEPQAGSMAELEWILVGEHYIEEDNIHRYSGHNLVNLRLQQRLTDIFSIGVRVTNLTDEDYAERADFGGPPTAPVHRYFVGEPRSTYVSLTAEF